MTDTRHKYTTVDRWTHPVPGGQRRDWYSSIYVCTQTRPEPAIPACFALLTDDSAVPPVVGAGRVGPSYDRRALSFSGVAALVVVIGFAFVLGVSDAPNASAVLIAG